MRRDQLLGFCYGLVALVSVCGGSLDGINPGGSSHATDDWSHCTPCECKWVSGKRTANCQNLGLKALPKFPKADKIQVLHLNGNPLGQLTDMAFVSAGLLNLQKLYLPNCSLTDVHPGAFSNLVILIELEMSANQLRTLHPGTFNGNIRLRKLWLTSNPLRSLHGFQFPELPHLRIVDLSHGHLIRLGKTTFSKLEFLEILHLDHNRFRRLEKRTFLPMVNLKSMTLQGNPWHCDCRLQDFWQWLMSNNLFNSPTACASPPNMKGNEWDKLSFSVLACAPVVHVPQPMVSVSTGETATLACLVSESPTKSVIHWIRSGVVIRNNSQSGGSSALSPANKLQKFTITTGPALFRDKLSDFERGPTASVIIPLIPSRQGGDASPSDPGIYYSSASTPTTEQQRNIAGQSSRRMWFNLTIENVQMSGSGGYTCRAKNSGGLSQANVTLVYSESVATYLDNRDISVLLMSGMIAGVLVFLTLGAAVICWVITHQRKQRFRPQAVRLTTATVSASGDKASHGCDAATTLEMREMKAGRDNETGLQTKSSFASSSATGNSGNRWSPGSNGDEPNCLAGEINDHNKGETSVSNRVVVLNDDCVGLQQPPAPPSSVGGGSATLPAVAESCVTDDSGCGGSASGNSCSTTNGPSSTNNSSRTTHSLQPQAGQFPDLIAHSNRLYPSPGWTSSSVDSCPEHNNVLWNGWNGFNTPTESQFCNRFDGMAGISGEMATLPRKGSSSENNRTAVDFALSGGYQQHYPSPLAFDLMAEMRVGASSSAAAAYSTSTSPAPSARITSSLKHHHHHPTEAAVTTLPTPPFPTDHLPTHLQQLQQHHPFNQFPSAVGSNNEVTSNRIGVHCNMKPPLPSTSPHQIPSFHQQPYFGRTTSPAASYTSDGGRGSTFNFPHHHQMAPSQSLQDQMMHCTSRVGAPSRLVSPQGGTISIPHHSPNSSMLWTNILARKTSETIAASGGGGVNGINNKVSADAAAAAIPVKRLESIQETSVDQWDEASDGLKKPASPMGNFSITTNPASSLLAQEIESRNEMLHALVKDKNDTPV